MEIAVVEEVPATSLAATAPAPRRPRRCTKSSASCPRGRRSSSNTPGGDAQLTLRAGRYATSLVVLPTDDFPSMTAGSLPHRFALSAQQLRGLIDRTRFAISTEETRYYLNGIYPARHRERRRARCCARSPPTATAWPASRSRCRRAPAACPA